MAVKMVREGGETGGLKKLMKGGNRKLPVHGMMKKGMKAPMMGRDMMLKAMGGM